jgi:hypothetical protein
MNNEVFQMPHRAYRSFRLQWHVLMYDIVVTLLLTGLLWWFLRDIAVFWTTELSFWMLQTGIAGHADVLAVNNLSNFSLIPAFDVITPTALPTAKEWWLTALLCVVLWICSISVEQDRLPLIYFLRLVTLVQISSLIFFYAWPNSLPTTIANFLTDVFRQSAGLMLLIPALFAATLYLFVLPWWVKYFATLSALFFLVIFVPLQAACCAWILHAGGIIFLPTLYLFFGLLPQIVALMGVYSFAASMQPSDEELVKRGILR